MSLAFLLLYNIIEFFAKVKRKVNLDAVGTKHQELF